METLELMEWLAPMLVPRLGLSDLQALHHTSRACRRLLTRANNKHWQAAAGVTGLKPDSLEADWLESNGPYACAAWLAELHWSLKAKPTGKITISGAQVSQGIIVSRELMCLSADNLCPGLTQGPATALSLHVCSPQALADVQLAAGLLQPQDRGELCAAAQLQAHRALRPRRCKDQAAASWAAPQ